MCPRRQPHQLGARAAAGDLLAVARRCHQVLVADQHERLDAAAAPRSATALSWVSRVGRNSATTSIGVSPDHPVHEAGERRRHVRAERVVPREHEPEVAAELAASARRSPSAAASAFTSPGVARRSARRRPAPGSPSCTSLRPPAEVDDQRRRRRPGRRSPPADARRSAITVMPPIECPTSTTGALGRAGRVDDRGQVRPELVDGGELAGGRARSGRGCAGPRTPCRRQARRSRRWKCQQSW